MQFTLYCFCKVFGLVYSGSSKEETRAHLFNLFNTTNTASSLTKVVYGRVSGIDWIRRISMNTIVCKTIRDDVVKYTYRKIIKKPAKMDKELLLQELLEFALKVELDIQKQVFADRRTDEVRKYIYSMKKMQESQFTSDDIFDTELKNEVKEVHDVVSSVVGQSVTQSMGFLDTSFFTQTSHKSSQQYYENILKQIESGNVMAIQFASHSGYSWVSDVNGVRYRLLREICERGIPIQIAINTPDAVSEMASHMRDENAYILGLYSGFEDCIEKWQNFISKFQKNYKNGNEIELKLIEIPILHHYVCCRMKDEEKSEMKVVPYTYGNSDAKKNAHIYPNFGSDEYKLFQKEFEYLWNFGNSQFTIGRKNAPCTLEANLQFFREILLNENCQEIWIFSIYAALCSFGEINKIINFRLKNDPNFKIKFLLPNPNNIKNVVTWYQIENSNPFSGFSIFEEWSRTYSNKCELHYTNLPITERLYIDATNKKMRVEHLSIPVSTEYATAEYIDGNIDGDSYRVYVEQFKVIFDSYSVKFL